MGGEAEQIPMRGPRLSKLLWGKAQQTPMGAKAGPHTPGVPVKTACGAKERSSPGPQRLLPKHPLRIPLRPTDTWGQMKNSVWGPAAGEGLAEGGSFHPGRRGEMQ